MPVLKWCRINERRPKKYIWNSNCFSSNDIPDASSAKSFEQKRWIKVSWLGTFFQTKKTFYEIWKEISEKRMTKLMLSGQHFIEMQCKILSVSEKQFFFLENLPDVHVQRWFYFQKRKFGLCITSQNRKFIFIFFRYQMNSFHSNQIRMNIVFHFTIQAVFRIFLFPNANFCTQNTWLTCLVYRQCHKSFN